MLSRFNGRSGPVLARNALQQHEFGQEGSRPGGFQASKCETWMTESHGLGRVSYDASVSDKPRNTKMARLSAFTSSEASEPTSLPRRFLGTAVNLSTIIRHGARSPLRALG